jgi:hypothetical protein
MFNKVKNILLMFFVSYGIFAFLSLLVNHFFSQVFTITDLIKYLWVSMFLMFIGSFCGAFVFKKGVSKKSLWIRRGIMIAISWITSTLIMFLFGIINMQTILLYTVKMIIGLTIFSIIAYCIADKIEKQSLQKINDKLNEMNSI